MKVGGVECIRLNCMDAGGVLKLSILKTAQALGDLEALHEGGRRVIRLHLLGKPAQTLQQLLHLLRAATRKL